MSANDTTWDTASGARLASSGAASQTGAAAQVAGIDIRPYPVLPSDVTGMDATQIMGILKGLDPDGVTQAGQAHTELGETLSRIADRIAGNAQTLAQNWQGAAAQAAMDRFQGMHDQTTLLAQQATQTGEVLTWLGTKVLPAFKHLPDPRVTSTTAHDEQTGAKVGEKVAGAGGALIGDGAGAVVGGFEKMLGLGSNGQAQANATAQKYLTALNEHLATAYKAMPSTIGAPAPFNSGGSPAPASVSPGVPGRAPGVTGASRIAPAAGPGGAVTPGGSGAVAQRGTGSVVSGTGSTSGTGGPSAAGQFTSAPSAHGIAGGNGLRSTGSLQGLTPPPGGAAPAPGASGPVTGVPGPGPGGAGPVSGAPVPAGLVPRSGEGGPEGGQIAGESGLTAGDEPAEGDLVNGPGELGAADPLTATAADGTVTSAPLGAQATDAAGTSILGGDDATGAQMTGVPMAGTGSGQQEKERRREAWMNEDESIWGMPADHVPPVIEGGG